MYLSRSARLFFHFLIADMCSVGSDFIRLRQCDHLWAVPYLNTHDHHHIPPAFACTCFGRKRPLFSFPHPLWRGAVCCVSYPFRTWDFALSPSYYPILGTLVRLSLGDLRVSSHFSPLTDLIAHTLSRGMSHSSCDVPSWHTSPDRYRFLQHIQLYGRHSIPNGTAYHLRWIYRNPTWKINHYAVSCV